MQYFNLLYYFAFPQNKTLTSLLLVKQLKLMIAKQCILNILTCILIGMIYISPKAQTIPDSTSVKNTTFYDLRGSNAFDIGAGTSVINGDFVDPKFEIYFQAGYKRYLFPHLNVSFGYHKFNLAYVDVFNEGFMSFDLNLESFLLPHNRFSPFIFAGAGYNASNYFKQDAIKFQGGGGIEYILTDGIGLKLYTDYNYVLSDELDGLIAGGSDDTYFRIALGMNYYFGGAKKKQKILENQPTIIKSNQIYPHN